MVMMRSDWDGAVGDYDTSNDHRQEQPSPPKKGDLNNMLALQTWTTKGDNRFTCSAYQIR